MSRRRLLFCCTALLVLLGNDAKAELVAYYPFEPAAPFADVTGNGHDAIATPSTNVMIVDGIRGTAAQFPGAGASDDPITEDDFLVVPFGDAPRFTVEEDVSVSIWIKRNDPQDDLGTSGGDGGADGIYDSLGGTTSGIQLFLLADGTVNGRFDSEEAGFAVVNSAGPNMEENFDEGNFSWHHIVYTIDREDAEALLYLDGEQIDPNYAAGDVTEAVEGDFVPSQDFWIGRANQHSADSMIDDFALFNHVLSSDEVSQLFDGSLSPADYLADGIPGDYDGDGELTSADIDRLSEAVRSGDTSPQFDLNSDGNVTADDRTTWVNDLKFTYFGDSNLDGEFNSADFVRVFTDGLYETEQAAGWGQGDWNGDGIFDSSDFVVAFTNGGYENGPRASTQAVPEPASSVWAAVAFISCLLRFGRSSEWA